MTKTSLIVGMGIGQLYKSVLTKLGHVIITVDSDINKHADFASVEDAIAKHKKFDTVHICTPNFTHQEIAEQVAPYAKIIFVEKPGVKTADEWRYMITTFSTTRFMMVKNNMWRTNITELQECAALASEININWINLDRVPNPGTWFTTKELAYGGVSRDLMPHLLSIFMALDPSYSKYRITDEYATQQWKLEDLLTTDYGTVKSDGIYNVDDYFRLKFTSADKNWTLKAQWRNELFDDKSIEFVMPDNTRKTFELGLCPEDAYQYMIADAVANIDHADFWKMQNTQDLWIHNTIEFL